MSGIAEFRIFGRVGAIKDVGTTVRVSIASNYSRKDNNGERIERVRWNEITIFSDATQAFVKKHFSKGDIVYAGGSISQTSYERQGERVYGTTLACERIELLAKANGHQDAAGERAPQTRQLVHDDDIPF